MPSNRIPPNQQLVGSGRWPFVGERTCGPGNPDWILQVGGCVESPFALSLVELSSLPQASRSIDIHCVTRWTKLDVVFNGVLLKELLDRAAVRPDAKFVAFMARSSRNHSSSLHLKEALELETLIATHVDDELLPSEHGGPIRGIVPGRYFYKSVKWLERIELLAENQLGFWEATSGYHDHADPWLEERYMAANIDRRWARQLIGSKDFSGQDLRSIDCSRRDLSGLNARGALLRDANFSRCQLLAADFSDANLSNAKFTSADLRGATFARGDLEGAELAGADLRGADFRGCSWFGTSLCIVDELGNVSAGAALDRTTQIDLAAIEQLTDHQRRYVEEGQKRTANGR